MLKIQLNSGFETRGSKTERSQATADLRKVIGLRQLIHVIVSKITIHGICQFLKMNEICAADLNLSRFYGMNLAKNGPQKERNRTHRQPLHNNQANYVCF